LIWAALRFGAGGATVAVAITALLTIELTADEVGAFSKQPIDDRALDTQLYILIAALTTLFLSAVVSERERSAAALAEATRREEQRALEERHRIARDLHDSVSQALFSTLLHTRAAQKALLQGRDNASGPLGRALSAIGELTRGAQSEMRALIFELNRGPGDDGLVAALDKHAQTLGTRDGLTIEVQGPNGGLGLSARSEAQLFAIGREALANIAKHSSASAAWVRVEERPGRVLVEIGDDGVGFDPDGRPRPGHLGLQSMRSRAAEIDARFTIASSPGRGTQVVVEASAAPEGDADGS
jgi:signal transduction histidine kinase